MQLMTGYVRLMRKMTILLYFSPNYAAVVFTGEDRCHVSTSNQLATSLTGTKQNRVSPFP